MKAVVLTGTPGKAELVYDRSPPPLRPGYILVDVKAVALNPTDRAHVDYLSDTKGCLLGCDYAGIVNSLGDPTSYSKHWTIGERICGFAIGGHIPYPEDGAFAEQIVVKADVQIRVPEYMSFEQAATLGVGVVTCGQGLVQEMGLRWPVVEGKGAIDGEVQREKAGTEEKVKEKETVLVYGGSSATGTLAIQFAKLAGYDVITTASPRNHGLLLALGASAAFDYTDPAACIAAIDDYTSATSSPAPGVKYIFDTISTPPSLHISAATISPHGHYHTILHTSIDRADITNTSNLAYTAIGEPVNKWGTVKDDTSGDFAFAKLWVSAVEGLLQTEKLRGHPARVGMGGDGLEGVLAGLQVMREGRVSGEKLVYLL